MKRIRRMALAAATCALALAAVPATAQYLNTMTGRQFGNMYAANADFLMSQMIQQAGWNAMRLSLEQNMRRQQQAAGRAAPPAPAAPAKAAYRLPITATDFVPAGRRDVPEQLAAGATTPKDRQDLVKAGRDIQRAIEATPGFRPNNVAAGMAVLLGVSLQVARGVEIPDDQSEALMRGLNDVLGELPAFRSLPADKRTRAYDTFVVVGGFIAAIAQQAAQTGDAQMAAQAKAMARDALAQFGMKG